MTIIICPGIHNSELTRDFVRLLSASELQASPNQDLLIFPVEDYPAYSNFHILQFLRDRVGSPSAITPSVVFIGFSAGVVGAIGAAWGWQLWGGQVKAFIAIDGWGVPLYGNFPIHRVSHDYFTHWSSSLLGSGEDSFYADPAVEHLELWRQPQTVRGWWLHPPVGPQPRTCLTSAQFLTMLLERYGD